MLPAYRNTLQTSCGALFGTDGLDYNWVTEVGLVRDKLANVPFEEHGAPLWKTAVTPSQQRIPLFLVAVFCHEAMARAFAMPKVMDVLMLGYMWGLTGDTAMRDALAEIAWQDKPTHSSLAPRDNTLAERFVFFFADNVCHLARTLQDKMYANDVANAFQYVITTLIRSVVEQKMQDARIACGLLLVEADGTLTENAAYRPALFARSLPDPEKLRVEESGRLHKMFYTDLLDTVVAGIAANKKAARRVA